MPRIFKSLWAGLPLLCALIAYGYSVRLPLFADDIYLFFFLGEIDGIQQWGGSVSFPYYRPMVFSLWKIAELLFGANQAAVLHGLNVLVLGIAGVFFALLVYRLSPLYPRWAGALAGVAFVLFPFTYQAVNLVSGMFHLLLGMGLLGCLVFTLVWLTNGGIGWLVLAWVLGFMGIFSHENGFLLAGLLILVLGVAYQRRLFAWAWRRVLFAVSVPFFASGLYLLLWFTLPRARSQAAVLIQTVESDKSWALLLQGSVYPFAALLRPLFPELAPPLAVFALVAVVILICGALFWWRGQAIRGLLVVALLWYAAAIIPSGLLLEAAYIENSPRLLLLASAGASLFWVLGLLALWQSFPRGRFLVVVFGIFALAVSLNFLRGRAVDYLRMGTYTWELTQQAQQADERGLVLVNAPNYIGPNAADRTFLIGAENANFITNELSYGQYFWVNTNERRFLDMPVTVVNLPALVNYPSGLFVLRDVRLNEGETQTAIHTAPRLVLTTFDANNFYPAYVGSPNSTLEGAVMADFGAGTFTLSVAQAELAPAGNTLTVTTQWTALQPQPVKRFVHVFCGGELIGQTDGYVWLSIYPFAYWQPDETQVDVLPLRLSRPATQECLEVKTGMYRESDGERLTAINPADGSEYVNGLVPIAVSR